MHKSVQMKVDERSGFYDVAKGLGIVLVVLGHILPWGSFCSNVIYGFHMPLFFIISGVLFSGMMKRPFGKCVSVLIGRILAPYIFFLVIGVFFWVLRTDCTEISLRMWARIFWSWFIECHPTGNGNLWFLAALGFSSFILRIVLPWGERNRFSKLFLYVLLYWISLFLSFCPLRVRSFLPLQLGEIPTAMFFMLIGWDVRECVAERWVKFRCPLSTCMLLLLLMLSEVLITSIYEPVGFAFRLSKLPFLFAAIAGSFFMFILVRIIMQRDGFVVKILSFVGMNSLFFFGVDSVIRPYLGMCLIGLEFPYKLIPGRVLAVGENAFAWTFVLFLLQMAVLALLIPWIKYAYEKFSKRIQGITKDSRDNI